MVCRKAVRLWLSVVVGYGGQGGLVWFVGVWEVCRERRGVFVRQWRGYGCLWWWDIAAVGRTGVVCGRG
ncbi:hypothetical protein [Bartonella elizabethae]|uniref:hypothetical protein n=1 Tax=Bartonella elizabethae TaxID=807 RepID=UPI00047C86CC|nr:hypothetical protein [Bartonella elizabethae]